MGAGGAGAIATETVLSVERTRWGDKLSVRSVALAVALLPLSRGHGSLNLAPVDVVMASGILVVFLWAGTHRLKLRAPYAIGVGIMIVAGLIASLAGTFTRTQGVALMQDVYLLAWVIAAANVVRVPGAIRVLLRAWSYAALMAASLIVLGVAIGSDSLAGINASIGSRAAFTFTDENSAGIYFALSIAILIASRTPTSKTARTAGAVLLFCALLVTGSLAGFLALGVLVLVAITVGAKRRYGAAAALGFLAFLLVVGGSGAAGVGATHLFDRAGASSNRFIRDSIGRESKSTGSRELLIHETTDLYLNGSLLGRGPASTRASLTQAAVPYPNEAHDDYLATITERGLLGALGLLVLIGAVAVRTTALDTRKLSDHFADSIARPVWLLGAVAAIPFLALTHEILHERTVWTLLAILAGIHAFGVRSAGAETSRS